MKKFMKDCKGMFLVLLICTLGLTACADKSKDDTDDVAKTSITLNKDGSISNKIVEDFSESYYDLEGLKTMIESAISEYAAENSSAQVTLKKCDVSDNVVNAQIEFGDYASYAGFNDESFFAGTIQDANKAGFNLNVTLNAASDKLEKTTISKPEILEMGDNHIIIVEAAESDNEEPETLRVNCFGDILYVGDGVSVVGKKSADISLLDGYGIIIFKK